MPTDFNSKAKELAARPYIVQVMADETTDGGMIYLAQDPELPGCLSQGATVEEAKRNLSDARIDFIQSLLEDGLPVPDPGTFEIKNNNLPVSVLVLNYNFADLAPNPGTAFVPRNDAGSLRYVSVIPSNC